MRTILVWGRQGLLAQAIRRTWTADDKLFFWGRHDLPVGRKQQHQKIFRLAPSAIVNASGFTNLRRTEMSPCMARELNVEVPVFLARISRELRVPFITTSSDYVFSGHGHIGWSETDPTEPINAYGRGKLEGERAVLASNPNAKIIRTAGLFGPATAGSKISFPERILEQVKFGRLPEVRSDLTTSICHVDDLASDLRDILRSSSDGIFHIANAGGATWLQIANHALESAGISSRIKAIRNPDFPRPKCSTLITHRPEALYGRSRQRSWQEALGKFMKDFSND